jgi:hypothetical protein
MRTTRRAQLAVILGARPGREASRSNPAMPKVKNRLRQPDTFLGVIFIAAAICLSCRPSAANSTIRARSTTRAASDRLRAHCSKVACWSELKAMAGAIRIHDLLPQQRPQQLLGRDRRPPRSRIEPIEPR